MGLVLGIQAIAVGSAHAQPAGQRMAEPRRVYNIAAGSLGLALTSFARTAGVELSVDAALIQGKASGGLAGSFTVEEGFAELLHGQGLRVVRGANGTYSLRAGPAAAPTSDEANASTLPAVTVMASAAQESAWGPVYGYVARRSATATKTDASLLEDPQSVSVITADEIGDRKAESLDETLRYTAGVTPNQRSLGSDDSSLLRGFTIEDTGIFQDGLRNSGRTFATAIEPYGLERVEVLRGPASVLYGQVPPGGLVNVVSKRPTADTVREIGVEYGSYDRKQIKGDFGGAIDARGTWTYRLTMLGRESNTRLDHDRDNRLYIAPALTWQPSAATRLTLLARYQKDNQQYAFPNQLQSPGSLGQVNPGVNITGYDNRFDRTNKAIGYEFEHRFNDIWSVRQNLRYNDLNNDRTDLFPTALQSDGRTIDRYFWPVKTESRSLYVDTQAQARFGTGPLAHSVLLGVDYARIRNTDSYPYAAGFVDPIDLYNPVYARLPLVPAHNPTRDDTPLRQIGLYAQDQLKWDRWVVTGGLRHDNVQQSSTTTSLDTGASTVGYDQSQSAVTGRLGAVYLFDSGWAPYLSYATSFAPEIGTSVSGAPLTPSRGKQLEAGVRYQPANRKSIYTLALFDLLRQNVTTAAPGNPGKVLQTGEVSSRGLELEARTELTRNFSVIAQYTYLDTDITKSNNGDQGLPQKGAPKHSASAWGKYAFTLGDSFRAFTALGIRYLGKMRSNSDSGNNNLTNPSLTLWDAAAGIERGPWRLTLNVNNLLNRQVLYDCGYLPGVCYRSAERTVNVSAAYRF